VLQRIRRCFSVSPRSLLHSPMRQLVRFLVLMMTVFGLSLAFAWAWDRSDAPKTTHTP